MAEQDAGAQALEQGYFGVVYDTIPNDAYTVSGQGPDTAQAELEQRATLNATWETSSRDPGDTSKSSSKSTKSSSGSSSGSSSS